MPNSYAIHRVTVLFMVPICVLWAEWGHAKSSLAKPAESPQFQELFQSSNVVARRRKNARKKKRKSHRHKRAIEQAVETIPASSTASSSSSVKADAIEASNSKTEKSVAGKPVLSSSTTQNKTTTQTVEGNYTLEVIEAEQVDNAPMGNSVSSTSEGNTVPMFPVVVAIEAGGVFPQVVSKLDTSYSFALELSYLLPVMEQQLAVFVEGRYSKPNYINRALLDVRLPGVGGYRYTTTEEEFSFVIGGTYRLFPLRTALNFYGQLGLQLTLQRSEVKGSASGEGFGKNNETAAALGGLVAVGTEWMLGPGALAVELDFSVNGLKHTLTGNTASGGLMLVFGYHVFF